MHARRIAGLILHEDGWGNTASYFYFASGQPLNRIQKRAAWERLIASSTGAPFVIRWREVTHVGVTLPVFLFGKVSHIEAQVRAFEAWCTAGMPVRRKGDVGFTNVMNGRWQPNGADVYWMVNNGILLTVGERFGERLSHELANGLQEQYGLRVIRN